MHGHHTDGFGGIHRAAAAEADEAIATFRPVNLGAPIHQSDGRIGYDLVETRWSTPPALRTLIASFTSPVLTSPLS